MATLTVEELKEIMDKVSKIDDMELSLQNLSDQYDQIVKDYKALHQEHLQLVKDHKALKSQVIQSSSDIINHSKAINDIEQYSRRDCIEIRGVPCSQDESTDDIVEKVGEIIGVEVESDDISISHRLPDKVITRKDGTQIKHDPAIIVKFTKRSTRDDFNYSRKELRNHSTRDLGFTRQREQPIFICESLTATNRKIFNSCLRIKKKNNYKFIWTHYGTTCLRKDSNSPVISIKSENDIRRLLKS